MIISDTTIAALANLSTIGRLIVELQNWPDQNVTFHDQESRGFQAVRSTEVWILELSSDRAFSI